MAQDGPDNELDGLFNISISEPEEGGDGGGIDTSHGIASSSRKSRHHRTGQSEDAFRAVRSGYRAKVENGEIWKSVGVPLGSRRVPKHEAQELLHAVEELYFCRRFGEAVSLVGRMFEGEGGGDGLDADARGLLRTYQTRCSERLAR